MRVQVLRIQPQKQDHLFDVQVLVGRDQHIFQVKVEETKLDKDSIQVASADRYSRSIMQHSARLMSQIDGLVLKVYNGQEVVLPITISTHLPKNPIVTKKAQSNGHQSHIPKGLDLLTLSPALQTT